eukprot:gene34661-57477_t
MPCTNVFDREPRSYQDSVLPLHLPTVAVEAAHPDFWRKYVGRTGAVVGIASFAGVRRGQRPARMTHAFDLILFDLDGTLIDHFAAIHRSHSHTLRQLGLPAPTLAQVRAAVGGGLEHAIAQLIGPARVPEALPIYRAYWDATMLDDVVLLPGALELLQSLHSRGTKLAVFTNKAGPSSRLICAHLGLAPFLHGNF